MIKLLYAPALLLAHSLCVLVYYLFAEDTFGWGVYFHTIQCIFLSLFAIIPRDSKGVTFQFQLVEFGYSGMLGIAFVADYYRLIDNPHGLIITSLAVFITTILIVLAGIRHGIFKKS